MIFGLLLTALPGLGAVLILVTRRRSFGRFVFGATALLELLLSVYALVVTGYLPDHEVIFRVSSLLGVDRLSAYFLLVTNILFCLTAFYLPRWLSADASSSGDAHGVSVRMREHVFLACLLLFLCTMTLVICSRNFGLLWVAVEATTLASAPLICYHRSGHSLEAMWKYLLICSVGIAFALFGTMLLSVSGHFAQTGELKGLSFESLATGVHPGWFKAAFVFLLAGYGTKMGLVPFHTWLPDAHSEAPGAVSALLSGTLLNCAFLAILRVFRIAPEELLHFCCTLLIVFGFLSVMVSAFFIIRQTDYKRLLAYSSVEHMGIVAAAWGLGAENAALIHLGGHTLIKGMLFLTAGNILLGYGTRSVNAISGLLSKMPRNAFLWLSGVILICGTPPSPLFVSEFMIIRQSFLNGNALGGGLLLVLLFIVFAGMSSVFFRMLAGKGTSPEETSGLKAEKLCMVPYILLVFASVSGLVLLYLLNRGDF